jgi:ElaB/YqjD/DUF883 family membrane-anchored ribosome-binding protein
MARAKVDTRTTLKAVETAGEDMAEQARETTEKVARTAAETKDALTRNVTEIAADVSEKLKAVGVDTDVMAHAAKEQAGEWQKLLAEELRTRPMRALGLAAAAGLIVGYLSSR